MGQSFPSKKPQDKSFISSFVGGISIKLFLSLRPLARFQKGDRYKAQLVENRKSSMLSQIKKAPITRSYKFFSQNSGA
jgi:hypothetical protein